MVLYSSLHFIFYVLDSKFTFHNTTLRFHDSKFEFLFSNSSSHFIFSVHDSTIEFHNATSLFQISIARSSHVALSQFNERHPLNILCKFQRKSAVLMRAQINMAENPTWFQWQSYTTARDHLDDLLTTVNQSSTALENIRDPLVAFTQRSGDTMKIPNL